MDFTALIARIQRLLLTPVLEWDAIAAEPSGMVRLYVTYVGPLLAVAALADMIGVSTFGIAGMFHVPLSLAIGNAIASFVAGLAGVYVLAITINALATQFGGTKDMTQAFKVAAYAPTAAWVASLLCVLPQLGSIAVLAGFYSFYLFFTGLPKLMKPEPDKVMAYTIAVCLTAVVIAWIVGQIGNSMTPALTPGMRVN